MTIESKAHAAYQTHHAGLPHGGREDNFIAGFLAGYKFAKSQGGQKSREQREADEEKARIAITFRAGFWAGRERLTFEKAWKAFKEEQKKKEENK